ncbi:MAG: hypothetical protein HC927_13465 [Deltaproteobacteria bacterium]|nr:hypothetical protein [Deltaproteobacteria bacterium]
MLAAEGVGMQPGLTGALGTVLVVAIAAICVAMAACTFRLIQGPSIADRVVALDLLASFIVGAIAVFSIKSGRFEIVSVAIVIALILFVGTAAFALYMEKGGQRQ